MKQSPVHLDTSALVDLCFWDSKAKDLVVTEIAQDDAVATPYVLFELARGFLSYLIALHNKALQLSTPADVIAYGRSIFRMGYRQAALLQSYETFLRGLPLDVPLTQRQQLELFRGDLSKRIRQGWRKAKSQCLDSSNKCGCRVDLPSPLEDENGHYVQKLPTKRCGKLDNCSVRDYIYKHDPEFRKVRDALLKLASPDNETRKRTKSVSEMLKLPRADFFNRNCWNLGDLIIVHETPPGATVVTKNKGHFDLLCSLLGRQLRIVPPK